MLRLRVDLTNEPDLLYGIDCGMMLAEKFFCGKLLPENLEVVMRVEQRTNPGFWQGLMGGRYSRPGALNHLWLHGLSTQTAKDLALYCHNKGINAKSIHFNGRKIT